MASSSHKASHTKPTLINYGPSLDLAVETLPKQSEFITGRSFAPLQLPASQPLVYRRWIVDGFRGEKDEQGNNRDSLINHDWMLVVIHLVLDRSCYIQNNKATRSLKT
jgi:hypothetical protein